MAVLRKCPACGATLPNEALDGNCPACLLRLGLSESSAATDSAPARRQLETGPLIRYFGDYELQRELARGGMGVVYEARQMSLNRPVALKMILAGQLATTASVHRFRLEAEAAARLDHPNIVPIYEIGEHDGRHFYSMKLMTGGSLAGWAPSKHAHGSSETRARQEALARLITKVARAVHYAHQHGILHRDLKPTNILLDGQGEPQVSDFGLAKLADSKDGLTLSGTPLGTPAYMAPEQAAGQSNRLSTAADVYSMGAILYELLTGRAPFGGATPLETMRSVVETEPMAPHLLNRQINRDLETICLKCLNKEPRARYPSALALAEDLEHWLAGEPITARPVGMFEKLWSRARRDPKLATLALVIVGALSVVASGSTLAAWRIAQAKRVARENLYQAYLAQAQAQRRSGQAGQRFASLEALARAAAIHPSNRLADEAIAALALPDLRAVKQWQVGSQPSSDNLVFDNALERYAQKTKTGISVRTVADNQEVLFLPVKDVGVAVHEVWLLGFDRQSRYLAALCHILSAQKRCRVWNLREQGGVALDVPAEYADFTPDSQRVAVARRDGLVSFFDLASGQEQSQFRIGRQFRASLWGGLHLSSDGTRLVTFPENSTSAQVWNSSSEVLFTSLLHTNPLVCAAWSDDARRVAFGCQNGQVAVWDMDLGCQLNLIQAHLTWTYQVRFDHRSGLLASAGWDGTLRLFEVASGRQVLIYPRGAQDLRFSPDDRLLAGAVEGLSCELLEVAHSTGYRRLCGPADSAGSWSIDFAPDGRLLVAAANGGGLRFWDTLTGTELGFVPTPSSRSAHFCSQGQLSLVASCERGVYQWPIALHVSNAVASVRLEPPRVTHSRELLGNSRVGALGKKLIAERFPRDHALLLELATPSNTLSLGPHPGCSYVSVDPLGRWAATGTWKGTGVKIWDVTTGRLLRDLPVEGSANVCFSPDGNWLATANAAESRLWRSASWECFPRALLTSPGYAVSELAFSPNSRLLAVSHGSSEIQLVKVPTCELVTTVSPGVRSIITSLGFSPDGLRLAALDRGQNVHLWDLRRIRTELLRLGLDWDLPPFGGELAPQPEAPSELRFEAMPFSRAELAQAIPLRESHAGGNLIDLTAFYNAPLTTAWSSGDPDNDLSELPQGVQRIADVDFDVRGLIQLGTAAANELSYPATVVNIPVTQSCHHLHFLHAALNGDRSNGLQVGSYFVHYVDGHVVEIPIVFGRDLADWFPKPTDTHDFVIAWTGSNRYVRRYDHPIRLFKCTWENPFPAVPIRSFDFASKGTRAAPFLVAVTAEP